MNDLYSKRVGHNLHYDNFKSAANSVFIRTDVNTERSQYGVNLRSNNNKGKVGLVNQLNLNRNADYLENKPIQLMSIETQSKVRGCDVRLFKRLQTNGVMSCGGSLEKNSFKTHINFLGNFVNGSRVFDFTFLSQNPQLFSSLHTKHFLYHRQLMDNSFDLSLSGKPLLFPSEQFVFNYGGAFKKSVGKYRLLLGVRLATIDEKFIATSNVCNGDYFDVSCVKKPSEDVEYGVHMDGSISGTKSRFTFGMKKSFLSNNSYLKTQFSDDGNIMHEFLFNVCKYLSVGATLTGSFKEPTTIDKYRVFCELTID